MVVNEMPSLTIKETWTPDNASALAKILGYVDDGPFRKALEEYCGSVVETAGCTKFLGTLAIGFFNRYKPPLTPIMKNQR